MASLSEPAFGEFYRQTVRALWAYAYRVTSNAADADDVVQDAFYRLLRANVQSTDPEDLRRYLFRIAGHLPVDRWRRSRREQSSRERRLPDIPASPEHDAGDVAVTFARLTPRERALLWLAYVEGDSHEEIAEAMGLARGSVKVLLSRARARLRNLLEVAGLDSRF